MLKHVRNTFLLAICLITSAAQAESEVIAKDLADSQIHLHLAISEGNSAESLLNNGDLNGAAAAYSQATEEARKAQTSVESALVKIQALREAKSGSFDENIDTAAARIMVANTDLLQAIDILEAKSTSPESEQPALRHILSVITTELINGTLYLNLSNPI